MARRNFKKLEEKLDRGESFKVTRSEYINLVGTDIPQDKSYTEKRSAIAKRAHERGYKVTVIPEVLVFEKIK